MHIFQLWLRTVHFFGPSPKQECNQSQLIINILWSSLIQNGRWRITSIQWGRQTAVCWMLVGGPGRWCAPSPWMRTTVMCRRWASNPEMAREWVAEIVEYVEWWAWKNQIWMILSQDMSQHVKTKGNYWWISMKNGYKVWARCWFGFSGHLRPHSTIGPTIWPKMIWWSPALWSPKWFCGKWPATYIPFSASRSSNSACWRRKDWSQTGSYHRMPSNGKVCWRATGFWMRTMRRTRKCGPAQMRPKSAEVVLRDVIIAHHVSFVESSVPDNPIRHRGKSAGRGRFVMLACGMPMSTWATDLAWSEPQWVQRCRYLCSYLSLGNFYGKSMVKLKNVGVG